MREKIRKFLLYFWRDDDYWEIYKIDEYLESLKDSNKVLLIYPLNLKKRIVEGHYHLDENNIPISNKSKDGINKYNITTITSYALALLELFEETNEKKYIDSFNQCLYFIFNLKVEIDKHVYYPAIQHGNVPCAMSQGEVISVYVRAYKLFNEIKYLDWAIEAAKSFTVPFGFVDSLNGQIWYKEAGKFILNGHIYSLIGLYELSVVSAKDWIYNLFEQGLYSVEKNIPLFDSGFWSYYWYDSQKYYSSMMYHNLHVIQLQILNKLDDKQHENISKYYNKFHNYYGNYKNRMLAGVFLILSKIKKKIGK